MLYQLVISTLEAVSDPSISGVRASNHGMLWGFRLFLSAAVISVSRPGEVYNASVFRQPGCLYSLSTELPTTKPQHNTTMSSTGETYKPSEHDGCKPSSSPIMSSLTYSSPFTVKKDGTPDKRVSSEHGFGGKGASLRHISSTSS